MPSEDSNPKRGIGVSRRGWDPAASEEMSMEYQP